MDKYTKSLILGLTVGIFGFGYSLLVDQKIVFPNNVVKTITDAIVMGLFALLVEIVLNHFNQPKK